MEPLLSIARMYGDHRVAISLELSLRSRIVRPPGGRPLLPLAGAGD
jgi:hypothetical protein